VIHDAVLRCRQYVGDTLFLGLLVQESDVILPVSRFCAVTCLTPQDADPATMDGRGATDGKFSVPYDSGARGFFVRLNRSFILFVKASSTVPA